MFVTMHLRIIITIINPKSERPRDTGSALLPTQDYNYDYKPQKSERSWDTSSGLSSSQDYNYDYKPQV